MEIKTTKGLHSSQIKALVYGNSGSGKTSLLGTLPENETVILSAESGLLCLSDKDIAVIDIVHWNDLGKAYMELMKPEYAHFKNVCIDSLTELSDKLASYLETLPEYRDPKQTMKMWGEYNKRITKTVKSFRDMPGRNVFFTALPENVLDEGAVTTKPYIKGSSAQRLLASWLDEVFFLDVEAGTGDRKLQTQPTLSIQAKDRSGKLDDYEEPNLTNIINKIKGN